MVVKRLTEGVVTSVTNPVIAAFNCPLDPV